MNVTAEPITESTPAERAVAVEGEHYERRRREQFIAGLKELIRLYETIDDLRAPVGREITCIFAKSLDKFLEWRAAGGFHDKDGAADDSHHQFRRDLSENVRVFLMLDKTKTCQRIEVGERVVPAQPAMPAQPERVEKVYRWECPESLLALNGS